MRSRGAVRRVVLGGRFALTNEGVDFQRRSRIPSPWSQPAGGVGGCVRNIGRGEPRSPIGFSLQCDARPNAGRTDAALAPVWSWTRSTEHPRDEKESSKSERIGNRRGTPIAWSSSESASGKDRASDISKGLILLGKDKEGERVKEERGKEIRAEILGELTQAEASQSKIIGRFNLDLL